YSEPVGLNTHGAKSLIYNAGNHSHNLNIYDDGNHIHRASSNSSGTHGHDITIGNTGNGNPVSFLPSYFNINLYKRIS
ncbi:MAG: hypothetical protein ACRC5T_08065, partial [Cetobacterium sp.]